MTSVVGADGCSAGWLRTCLDPATRQLHVAIVAEAPALLAGLPGPAVLAIDIPIGLVEAGTRACDREARSHLGWPRRASVFPPPLRPALAARSRAEAARITEAIEGKRVGAQAFGIYAKVREVDAWLRADATARPRVFEAHPELCFWALAGGRAMVHSKKSPAGRAERASLLDRWLGIDVVARARASIPRRSAAADDDILDSVATLWTASRIAAGTFVALGGGETDAIGLPMRICF